MKKIGLRKRISYFIVSFLLTLMILRLFLFFSPFTNFNLGKYNIHHLFLGALILVVISVLLLMEIMNFITLILTGVSSALVVDELVYLIATDGSDSAYLSSVSWWGAGILSLAVLGIAGILYYEHHK